MAAFRFTAARSGAVTALHLYVGVSSRATGVAAGIYSDVGRRPGRVLTTGVIRRPVRGKWNLVVLAATRLRQGAHYWLALLPAHGTLVVRDRTGPRCRRGESVQSRLRKLPARAGRGAERNDCSLSAYVTGNAAAPAAPNPAPPSSSPPPGGCFAAPGACGFPDPGYHNVGATSSCSSLPSSGSIDDSTPGSTIANRDVTGGITIDAQNVTIENVCVTTNGGAQLGSRAILLEQGAANATITHVTVGGANETGESVDQAIANDSGSNAAVTSVYAYNCGECIWNGPWTMTNSYVITNGMQGTSDHLEDVYMSDSTVTLNRDVLLDPSYQNSTVFGDTQWGSGGPCDNHWTITDSLLAGGGFVIYTCGNASSVGSSTMDISNNRFARCTTPPFSYNHGTGGTACQGSADEAIGAGADSHGYWPDGGYFGVDAYVYCPPRSDQTWSGNVWDDTGAAVGC